MTSHHRSEYARTIRNNLTRTTAREPQPNARHRNCTACGSRPTQAFSGSGLSQKLCTACVRLAQRHGTPFRKSYSAAELRPYLWAARRWLKENKNDSLVERIEMSMVSLLETSGSPVISTRMLRADAKSKAKNALARMRVRSVKPSRLMAIVLATHAILKDDQSFSHRGNQFLHIQIARQAHRLAARFTPAGMEGKKSVPGVKLKWGHESFGQSAGLFMRELGFQLDEFGGHLVDRALPRILELKVQRWDLHPSRQAFEDMRLSVDA